MNAYAPQAKFYSFLQVFFGTVFFGPIAGIYFIDRSLGFVKSERQRELRIIGSLFSVLVAGGIFFLPRDMQGIGIPWMVAAVMAAVSYRYMQPYAAQYEFHREARASFKVFLGYGLFCLLGFGLLILAVLGVLYVTGFLPPRFYG